MTTKRNQQVNMSRKSTNKRSRYVFKYIYSNNGISVINNKGCRVLNRRVSLAPSGIRAACYDVNSQFISRCRLSRPRRNTSTVLPSVCIPPAVKYESTCFENHSSYTTDRYCNAFKADEPKSAHAVDWIDWMDQNCDPFGSHWPQTPRQEDPTGVNDFPF